MARNELLNLAYKDNYDITVFIDDDEYWSHEALIDILLSEKDVITIPVINKNDKKIEFNIPVPEQIDIDTTDGYFRVQKTGTGFLKLSKKVIEDLWQTNTELIFRGKKLKNICEYTYESGAFVGEDITLSKKISELGYDIWCYPSHTVSHIGLKMFKGDFRKTYNL